MRLKQFGLALIALGLIAATAVNVRADVSAAGVLFLKLPPGARAAAMGESFVAVANDATATHWNPAGLGADEFSSSWVENELPQDLQPFTGFAAVKSRGGIGYRAYDIWAITAKGLARYDGDKWTFSDKVTTRTDQQMNRLVTTMFGLSNDQEVQDRSRKISEANSPMTYDAFVSFLDGLVADLPEDAKQKPSITVFADSLKTAYDQCLVSWEKIDEAKKQLAAGKSDNSLASVEIDRILFALERGRNRFLPEQLTIPFSAGYSGDATVIASRGEVLLLGTTDGLFQFSDKRWLRARSDANAQFAPPVQAILPLGSFTIVGYTNGMAKYLSGVLAPIDHSEDLPKDGSVSALGGNGVADIWAAINDDLYHWNGSYWANWQQYTTVLDDTANRIAEKFSLYGTKSEIDAYMTKLEDVNAVKNMVSSASVSHVPGNLLSKPDQNAVPAENDSINAEVSADDTETTGEQSTETPVVSATEEMMHQSLDLSAGQIIRVPYLAGFRGKVTAIYPRNEKEVWVGTEYGVFHFSGTGWDAPGYTTYTPAADEQLALIENKATAKSQETKDAYAEGIKVINDLEGDIVPAGKTIKIYRTPAAAPTRTISRYNEDIYVATSEGLLVVNKGQWSRAGFSGIGNTDAVGVQVVNDEAWAASSEKVVTRSNGRSELALMHVQLLPGLGVEDVYYEFLSFVTHKQGWGGLGGEISFLSLGKNERTDENNQALGDFYSFETAVSLAYGTSLTKSLKGGIAAKVIYSRLSAVGAGQEQGSGTTTGFALDGGLLYFLSDRLTFGTSIRNIGPDISYIDAAQSDPLPRTLSVGFAYKLANSGNMNVLLSTQIDKELVAMNDGFSKELSQTAPSAGIEFMYANLFAVRGGYKYDGEDPDNSVATFGAGLVLANRFKFDFAYTPGFTSEAQKNTLRSSLGVMF